MGTSSITGLLRCRCLAVKSRHLRNPRRCTAWEQDITTRKCSFRKSMRNAIMVASVQDQHITLRRMFGRKIPWAEYSSRRSHRAPWRSLAHHSDSILYEIQECHQAPQDLATTGFKLFRYEQTSTAALKDSSQLFTTQIHTITHNSVVDLRTLVYRNSLHHKIRNRSSIKKHAKR